MKKVPSTCRLVGLSPSVIRIVLILLLPFALAACHHSSGSSDSSSENNSDKAEMPSDEIGSLDSIDNLTPCIIPKEFDSAPEGIIPDGYQQVVACFKGRLGDKTHTIEGGDKNIVAWVSGYQPGLAVTFHVQKSVTEGKTTHLVAWNMALDLAGSPQTCTGRITKIIYYPSSESEDRFESNQRIGTHCELIYKGGAAGSIVAGFFKGNAMYSADESIVSLIGGFKVKLPSEAVNPPE